MFPFVETSILWLIMTISMNDNMLVSVAQLKEFANLNRSAKFKSQDKIETTRLTKLSVSLVTTKKQKRTKGL